MVAFVERRFLTSDCSGHCIMGSLIFSDFLRMFKTLLLFSQNQEDQ